MTSTEQNKVDKSSRLSGYHPPQVDITSIYLSYHLLFPLAHKTKISLPGSDSE